MLLILPDELLLCIAAHAPIPTLATLTLLNRRLHAIFDQYLYTHDMLHDDLSLLWAACLNRPSIASKSIAAAESLPPKCRCVAIRHAAVNDNPTVLALLLRRLRCSQASCPHRIWALHEAVEKGYLGVLGVLVDSGQIDIRSPRPDVDEPPLHRALSRLDFENRSCDVANMLLDLGAVDASNVNQRRGVCQATALDAACRNDQRAIARRLIAIGADINCVDVHNETPVYIASSGHNLPLLRYLLTCNADPNVLTVRNRTALHFAAAFGQEHSMREVMHLLLAAPSINVNARTPGFGTALHSAVAHDREMQAQMLLEAGANTEIRDEHGMTPLDVARHLQNERLVAIITAAQDKRRRERMKL